MTKQTTRGLLWLAWAAPLLVGLSACGGSSNGRFNAQRSLLSSPVALGSKLLLVERESATAFLLDATAASPTPLRAKVLPEPTAAVARAAHAEQALVLSSGVSGDRNALQTPGGLTLLDSGGVARTFSLNNNPFDFLVQQPAGRYVALLRNGTSAQLLQNANEMALVDLDADEAAEPGSAVRKLTLPGRHAKQLQRLLFEEGITGSSMFPGPEGVVKSMKEYAIWSKA